MPVAWTVTKDTASDTVSYESVGSNTMDLTQVQIGDYVNISGSGFNILNRGSFEVTNVEVYYVVSTLHQIFEISNPQGIDEVATQNDNSDIEFFRPNVQTIANSNGRTVVVSSTVDGTLDISIPATTQAVSRVAKTGSYPHENQPITITRIARDKLGETTVYYSGSPSPSLSVGDTFYLDGLNPTPPYFFTSLGDKGTWPATGTTDAAAIDNISILQEVSNAFDTGRTNFDTITALNGDGLIVGGSTLVASVPTADSHITHFRPVSNAVVTDGTLADGATRYTYEWVFPGGTTANSTELNRAANITVGPEVGKVMINGGASLTLTNYDATTVNFGASKSFDPVSAATVTNGFDPQPFCGHTLNTLVDGRIISYGGGECLGNWLDGYNSFAGYIWNPATEAWPNVGFNDIATFQRRAHHCAVELQDKKIMFIGGLAGAQTFEHDSKTLAYWQFSENGGSGISLADSSSHGYTLTTSGTQQRVQAAKVGSGRDFSQAGAYAHGASDPTAVAALKGDWTVEWWSSGVTGAYPGGRHLSGQGSGAIVAHGVLPSSDGVAADNILMECGIIDGTYLYTMWESGAGSNIQVYTPITGHIDGCYNHFAVRKRVVGDCIVDFFVNGHLISSQSGGFNNAFGGSNGQWYVASSMDAGFGPSPFTTGAPSFTGVIDSIVVEAYARSDEDILLDYWKQSATLPTSAGSRQHRIGRLLNECETFDPLVPLISSVAQAASMGTCRAYHTGTLLPDGRVLVVGGLAHDPTNFVSDLYAAGPQTLLGAAKSSSSSEFFDPATGQWTKGPNFVVRRHKHTAIYVPSRKQVFIIGGESTEGDDVLLIEVLDIATMRVKAFAERLTYQAKGACLLNNDTILVATSQSDGAGGILKLHQFISLESPGLSSKGLSDYHVITGVGSGFFTIETPASQYYFSNFSQPNVTSPGFTITHASRNTNVTTVQFAGSHVFKVNDEVYVNFNNTVLFASGMFKVTGVSSNSITYDETAANQGSTALTGSVFANFSPDATATTWAAQSDSIPGPYLIDPLEGVSISNTQTTIGGPLDTGIFKHQKYTILPVVNATSFPDKEGWIVIGFGGNLQTIPIKYFGRFNDTGLLIDYNYQFQNTMPTGTEVTLLTQRDPFVPTTLVGELYATSSAAGRIAAENTIKDISAAGINLNVVIVYPGDRGLGGEGLPAKGATKLSDKVAVWGGDNLDSEIADLKDS